MKNRPFLLPYIRDFHSATASAKKHRLKHTRHNRAPGARGARKNPNAAHPVAKWTFEAFIHGDKMPGSPRPAQNAGAA